MQYFVGFLVEDKAAKYYKNITTDLSERFGIKNLSEYIPPHFTIKIPFETEAIELFESYIAKSISTLSRSTITITNFGMFEGKRKTIFLEGIESVPGVMNQIATTLNKYDTKEKVSIHPIHPHLSFARSLSEEEYQAVWTYLQQIPSPVFNLDFNNLTVFRLNKNIWEVYKTYRF